MDSGKTYLLCTATELFKDETLIISMHRRDETSAKFAAKGVQVIDLIKVAKDLGDWPTTLKATLSDLKLAYRGRYRFIGFDDVSRLSHMIRMEAMHQRIAKRGGDADVPEQHDYQVAQNRVVEFMWEFRNQCVAQGTHLWITAGEKDEWLETTEDGPEHTHFYPDLPPELGRLLRHDWSFLGRMTLKREQVQVNKAGTGLKFSSPVATTLVFDSHRVTSKNRIGFPGRIEKPTVASLLGPIYKDIKREVEPVENDPVVESDTDTDSEETSDAVQNEPENSGKEGTP